MGDASSRFSLTGRRALVCGASRGIGRAIATLFAEAGANVTAIARDGDSLAAMVSELARGSDEHTPIAVDLTQFDSLTEAVERASGQEGDFDILVNNSGGPVAGPASEAEPDAFRQAFQQHLLASQVLVKLVAPGMKRRGVGRIINVISTSVKEPIPGLGVSNTVRGAVANWAKTLAYELGPHGITVNNLLPGYTKTDRLTYIFGQRAERDGTSLDAVERQAMARVPLGRFARPDEIASAALFLASDAAAYINGINLPVDGGRTLSL